MSKEVYSLVFILESLIFLIYYPSSFIGWLMKFDNVNYLMVCFSLFLGSILLSICCPSQSLLIFILFYLIIMFFSTDSLMIFFICYEFSLIPLMIILICWGTQAERIIACQFMFLYTIILSSPLLLLICNILKSFKNLSMMYYFPSNIDGIMTLCLIAFLVKGPILTLHSWLPKAHVESPIEGSIILAGIMLKFGIYGLIMLQMMFYFPPLIKLWMHNFSIFSSILSSIIAISSDDMKMSVAYSSVSHMNFLICAIFSNKLIIWKGSLMMMISHGFSSSLLFLLVTKIYYHSNSRSIILSKGIGSKFPLLSILAFMCWCMNFSPPPSLSFMGEISMISSILSTHPISLMMIGLYMIFISFFSILNYGLIFHSPMKSLTTSKSIHNLSHYNFFFLNLLLLILMYFFFESLWF